MKSPSLLLEESGASAFTSSSLEVSKPMKSIFWKKVPKIFGGIKKRPYLCTRIRETCTRSSVGRAPDS